MQFDSISSKNGVKHKRLKEQMKIKNNLNWCRQCEMSWDVSYFLYSYWAHAFWW
jgi:hypothetical protein